MKKQVSNTRRTAFAAILLSAAMSLTAFAGSWQADDTASAWRYVNDDGTYAISCWQWIDGNGDGIAEYYYFDANGYCLMNTITPDGNTVDATGAWTIDGVVQTQIVQPVSEQIVQAQPVLEQAAQKAQPAQTSAAPSASSCVSSAPFDGYTIVVNNNTKKYHVPSCSSVKDIKETNIGYCTADTLPAGYVPCKRCH